MKHTMKISGVALGMALAMTVAYASTEDRSGPPPAQRDASLRTSQITIPQALRPTAALRNCEQLDAFCATRSLCVGVGGIALSGTDCPTTFVCCLVLSPEAR